MGISALKGGGFVEKLAEVFMVVKGCSPRCLRGLGLARFICFAFHEYIG